MKITSIKYSKVITAIQEDTDTKKNTITTIAATKLKDYLQTLECCSIVIGTPAKIKKTLKTLKELGFIVNIDEAYGFEWEVKLYCSI
jgi:RNase H-fold protein (predicted Holliday junction resolvase)